MAMAPGVAPVSLRWGADVPPVAEAPSMPSGESNTTPQFRWPAVPPMPAGTTSGWRMTGFRSIGSGIHQLLWVVHRATVLVLSLRALALLWQGAGVYRRGMTRVMVRGVLGSRFLFPHQRCLARTNGSCGNCVGSLNSK